MRVIKLTPDGKVSYRCFHFLLSPFLAFVLQIYTSTTSVNMLFNMYYQGRGLFHLWYLKYYVWSFQLYWIMITVWFSRCLDRFLYRLSSHLRPCAKCFIFSWLPAMMQCNKCAIYFYSNIASLFIENIDLVYFDWVRLFVLSLLQYMIMLFIVVLQSLLARMKKKT